MPEYIKQSEIQQMRKEWNEKMKVAKSYLSNERKIISLQAHLNKPKETPCEVCGAVEVGYWLTNKMDRWSGKYLCNEHSKPYRGRKGTDGFSFRDYMLREGHTLAEGFSYDRWIRKGTEDELTKL